jgi:hypothetical protein
MLESLRQLQSLNMAYTNITDPGVRQLCNLTSLTYLSIDSRLITDGGLMHLPRLKELKALDLFGCKVRPLPGIACLPASNVLHAMQTRRKCHALRGAADSLAPNSRF